MACRPLLLSTIDVKTFLTFFKIVFLLLEPLFYYKNVGTSVTQKGALKTFLIILHRLLRYLKQAGSATW